MNTDAGACRPARPRRDRGMRQLPRSGELLHGFTSDPPLRMSDDGVVPVLAQRLARSHAVQWEVENAGRSHLGIDAVVATAKRLVDELNTLRSGLIEQIDAHYHFVASTKPPDDLPLHTETLGSVIDRLAIAWVRSRRLGDQAADSDSRVRARLALQQLAELADAYDDLVRDVEQGRRRLPSWLPLKSYGGQR